jgi:sugar phosphate isomerase/epimerase
VKCPLHSHPRLHVHSPHAGEYGILVAMKAQKRNERKKMASPVALQLYTLRDQLVQDFEGVIRQVAGIGYAGVEPAGFAGTTPAEARELFRELHLDVPAAHVPMPEGERQRDSLDLLGLFACKRLVSGLGPDHFGSLDDIKRACERFNEASRFAGEHGASFGIHNHWWEFEPVEGQLPYQVMTEYLDPAIFWEIDTYWIRTAGLDPADVLRELGARAPLLHIKDGPATKEEPMVALGEGVMDFPRVIAAGEPHAEWLIVELDRCATDMMEAVARSYRYLVEEGLGRGTQA